jgi:hypothetical protein
VIQVLLGPGEEGRAVYGPPLPAVTGQEAVPSDHLPIRAEVTFRVMGEPPLAKEA